MPRKPTKHATPAGDGEPAESSPQHAGTEPGTSITQATSVPRTEPRFKTRSIVFTIFGSDERPLPTLAESLRQYATNECEYMRFGREVAPTTGREHLQGWLQWTNPRQVNKFWRLFNHPHIEPRHGTVEHNQAYTCKDGDWEEYGTPPKQGDRADWALARLQLADRQSVREVIDAQPHLLPAIRALERYASLTRQPLNDRDVRVLYIEGRAGCGKTRAIHAAFPDAYWKPEGEWWDGYEGQPVVVLDDYYSDIRYQQLLRVLDRYPLRLPVKGGFVPAEYTTVLITSNAHLDEQYPNTIGTRRHALYRRIHCVIEASDGISATDITNALEAPPIRPQVRTPQVTPHDTASTAGRTYAEGYHG